MKSNGLKTLQEIADSGDVIFASKEIQYLTIEKAQLSKPIAVIRKETGENYTQIIFGKIITEALRILPSKMSLEDITYFSKLICNRFWNYRIDEIILIFQNGMNNIYGKRYGDFTIDLFFTWMEQYEKQREDFFYNKHLDSKTFYEMGERASLSEENHDKSLKDFIEKAKYFK